MGGAAGICFRWGRGGEKTEGRTFFRENPHSFGSLTRVPTCASLSSGKSRDSIPGHVGGSDPPSWRLRNSESPNSSGLLGADGFLGMLGADGFWG